MLPTGEMQVRTLSVTFLNRTNSGCHTYKATVLPILDLWRTFHLSNIQLVLTESARCVQTARTLRPVIGKWPASFLNQPFQPTQTVFRQLLLIVSLKRLQCLES